MPPVFFQEQQQQQQQQKKNTDCSLIMDLPDPGSSSALSLASKIVEQNIDSNHYGSTLSSATPDELL